MRSQNLNVRSSCLTFSDVLLIEKQLFFRMKLMQGESIINYGWPTAVYRTNYKGVMRYSSNLLCGIKKTRLRGYSACLSQQSHY